MGNMPCALWINNKAYYLNYIRHTNKKIYFKKINLLTEYECRFRHIL